MRPEDVDDMTDSTVLELSENILANIRKETCEGSGVTHSSTTQLPPQLIVALEADTYWREGASCGLQLSQYAFASAPGHPIFLDVIRRVMATSRRVQAMLADGDLSWNSDSFILSEWSGPVLWTEAVYRYLRARWGFDIRKLDTIKKPVRVGDVLIFPKDSFRAGGPGLEDEIIDQPQNRYIWHGSMGFERWRAGSLAAEEQARKLTEMTGTYIESIKVDSGSPANPLNGEAGPFP